MFSELKSDMYNNKEVAECVFSFFSSFFSNQIHTPKPNRNSDGAQHIFVVLKICRNPALEYEGTGLLPHLSVMHAAYTVSTCRAKQQLKLQNFRAR